jgi:hypothetical protein
MKIYARTRMNKLFFGIGFLLMSLFYQGTALAHEDANEKTEIPATTESVWKAIDQNVNEVDNLIKTDKLSEIHHHAAAIADLANALPGLSTNLSADKLQQVIANLKFINTLAKRLDASGDANDKAATLDNLVKLKRSLDMIRINYTDENLVGKNSTPPATTK